MNKNENKTNAFEFNICKKQFQYHKQSGSNHSISDSQISHLCSTINHLKISMKDTITNVYHLFLKKIEDFQFKLESISNFITLLDVIYTKATIAKKYNYCKPEIVDEYPKSFLEMNDLRHCLIEHIQQNEIYVTNNITLGKGEKDGILLYGTNAVGKTSFIRAIGIAVIMAQAGLYVPCSKMVFKPYKYIFTRILGNDNIFKGLSTFAVEMSELRTILRLSDMNSLILGDELCSGTENSSAISIFVTGIQWLIRNKCSFIFATHLHEIVHYDEINEMKNVSLKHMAVVYDREKDVLVYDRKLRDGSGDNMYGLEVCKSLNLPDEFLKSAYNIRIKYNPCEGSILSKKTSHFNSQKIINMCEQCKINPAKEVHHLQYQKDASSNGIILNDTQEGSMIFHKNKLANLMSLCESCHDKIHKTKKYHKKTKTIETSQIIISEIK
jgi:DNA mismatch repair protein MutS